VYGNIPLQATQFQNRYRSIVVEEDPYLLELVRYLYLNPLRATVVPDLRTLTRYPWTGHSALLGTVPPPWQETATILARVLGQTRGNMSLAAKRGAAWTPAWQAAIRQWCRAGKR